MKNTYYNLYQHSCILLARSIVIKCQAAAETINQVLTEAGYIIPDDQTTWKYYQNISGVYHETDALMTIISLDTLEEIAFNKANLALHISTAEAYSFGSTYYKALVARYPEQEGLIAGIINPVDINAAIVAADGTILNYNRALVEANESNLVPEIQKWITAKFNRWYNQMYIYSDDLYISSFYAFIYTFLPEAIILARLANCHTIFVHSFHIRMYLAGFGGLDRYMDVLTNKQALFLYRNIRYIRSNAGTQNTFNLLVKNLLTDRRLPIAAYEMYHNTADLTTKLYPEVRFSKNPINLLNMQVVDSTAYTVTDILIKETTAARGNASELHDANVYVTKACRYSPMNSLKTKVLESSVVDNTGAEAVTLASVLMYQWIDLAHSGKYLARFNVPMPGGATVSLSAIDCFVFWLYAYSAAYAAPLDVVPSFNVHGIPRSPEPTDSELRGIIPAAHWNQPLVDWIRGQSVSLGAIYSAADFYKKCVAIQRSMLNRRQAYVSQEHADARGFYAGLVGRFYVTKSVGLGSDGVTSYRLSGFTPPNGASKPVLNVTGLQTFDEWLTAKGIDVSNYTAYDFIETTKWIWESVTGLNLNTRKSLKEIQGAMLDIMRQLSSYSVQFLQDINVSADIIIDQPGVRVGDIDSISYTTTNVVVGSLYPTGGTGDSREGHDLEVTVSGTNTIHGYSSEDVELTIDTIPDYTGVIYTQNIDIAPITVLDDDTDIIPLYILDGFKAPTRPTTLKLDGLTGPL